MYKSFSLQAHVGSTPYYIIYIDKTIRNHSPNINNPSDSSLFSFHFSLKIHRIFKRSPFGLQNESFWRAKGVLLMSKTSPFGGQKESF